MKTSHAVNALAALAQETRIRIFRLLVRHAPGGLPAGTIARRLRLPGPTLSFHLNVLAAADLVRPHKNGRSISYSANPESVYGLTGYLMENCCGGRRGCAPGATRARGSRSIAGKLPQRASRNWSRARAL